MTTPQKTAARVLARIGWNPVKAGPVPLRSALDEFSVNQVSLPQLSLSTIAQHLLQEGYVQNVSSIEDMLDDTNPLHGLCFRMGSSSIAFVLADDVLARRRFTAAHELGHALLHQDQMERFLLDDENTISEQDTTLKQIEREANQFAAELLMPEELIRDRAAMLQQQHRTCPRLVLGYQLSSELLVSREAIRYRLQNLKVGHD